MVGMAAARRVPRGRALSSIAVHSPQLHWLTESRPRQWHVNKGQFTVRGFPAGLPEKRRRLSCASPICGHVKLGAIQEGGHFAYERRLRQIDRLKGVGVRSA